MPIGTLDPGTDEYDLAVNYGGYRSHMFFGGGPHCAPLPAVPRPVPVATREFCECPVPCATGERCECPHCASEGWWAQSPACKYWRAGCELCEGTRIWLDYSAGRPPRRRPCDLCAHAWREDVRWFRDALRNPRGVAQRLRDEAATHRRAAQEQADRGERP
jgi:hypothetical protein